MIPEGLKFVTTTLRQLDIDSIPDSFQHRLRLHGKIIEGDDYHKVRHIPFISLG